MQTTQLQTPEFIPVHAQLLAAVHNYLITRPYQEVAGLVAPLMEAARKSTEPPVTQEPANVDPANS